MSENKGISSAMIASMQKHGGGESDHSSIQPIGHSKNMDAGWDTPVFQDKLELFPGAKGANLDAVMEGVSGTLDSGIIEKIKHENAFSQNAAGAFDGTIMSQGNVGHEGLNLKLSGDTAASHIAPAAQTGLGDGIDVIKGGGGMGQG